jgi:hypothetical protein
LTTNGPEIYDGVMVLVNKINNEGIGPYAIKLVICDDKYILDVAKACWKKFAVDDPVQFVLGGHTSFTVPAGDYFEKFGILNIQYASLLGPFSHFTHLTFHAVPVLFTVASLHDYFPCIRCCTGPELVYTSTKRKWM